MSNHKNYHGMSVSQLLNIQDTARPKSSTSSQPAQSASRVVTPGMRKGRADGKINY